MSYQVIARKWRPQDFGAIVGQDAVSRSLRNALTSGRVAHAFLFSGIRGVGKTTTARILARALNCKEGPTDEPCGQCPSCTEIAEGNSIDVQEIDAASNTGVDNIRDLRESSRYGTARDRYKIFIIDEVHMLSKGAFNALLKTLEEPPEHVKFILATTEEQKVPITIRSRCQHYDFRPISFSLILERLQLIAAKDGIEASDYALRSIAAKAEGSMRDAQSALDQVIAFSGSKIADDDVNQILGVVDRSLVASVLDAVLDRDRPALLKLLVGLTGAGLAPADFCHGLVEHVRTLMLCRAAGWDCELLQLPDNERERVEAQAGRVSEIDLIRFYDVVSATERELKWHRHPQAHLEISLLKLIELAHLPRLEKILSTMGPEKATPPAGGGREAPAAVPPGVAPPKADEPQPPPEDNRPLAPKLKSLTNDATTQLLVLLQAESMGLYQHLHCAEKIDLNDETLSVHFSARESIHATFLEDPDRRRQLLDLCEKVVSTRPKLDIQVAEETQSQRSDPTQDPDVQMLLKHFPGKVIVSHEE